MFGKSEIERNLRKFKIHIIAYMASSKNTSEIPKKK